MTFKLRIFRMGFKYTVQSEPIGFDFSNPLTTDALSTKLLHMDNQRGKPYLTGYIYIQISEFINPPIVIPEISKELYLVEGLLKNTYYIDPESPIIKCGYLKLDRYGKVDPSSYAVKDGVVPLYKGNIDNRCKVYRDAIKRLNYIKKLARKKNKGNIKGKQRSRK